MGTLIRVALAAMLTLVGLVLLVAQCVKGNPGAGLLLLLLLQILAAFIAP